jgi:hypothetical protein
MLSWGGLNFWLMPGAFWKVAGVLEEAIGEGRWPGAQASPPSVASVSFWGEYETYRPYKDL